MSHFNVTIALILFAADDPSALVRAAAARHWKARDWRGTHTNGNGISESKISAHSEILSALRTEGPINRVLQPFVENADWLVQLATLTNRHTTQLQMAAVIDRNSAEHLKETQLAISRNPSFQLRDFGFTYLYKKFSKPEKAKPNKNDR